MTSDANDHDLQRLMDERKHMRFKLKLAQEQAIRDEAGMKRLRRSLEEVDKAIASGLQGIKTPRGD